MVCLTNMQVLYGTGVYPTYYYILSWYRIIGSFQIRGKEFLRYDELTPFLEYACIVPTQDDAGSWVFNAMPLVFYVNSGGQRWIPPQKLLRSFLGHFLGSFVGHKKVPYGDFQGIERFLNSLSKKCLRGLTEEKFHQQHPQHSMPQQRKTEKDRRQWQPWQPIATTSRLLRVFACD